MRILIVRVLTPDGAYRLRDGKAKTQMAATTKTVDTLQRDSAAWMLIFGAWVLSLLGMLVSLFFSEVMKLPPCALCWYQRICMYPLVAVFATGFLLRDVRVLYYSWPFVILGLLISGYHNLIYYGVIPEKLSPCTGGVSCATPQWSWMGLSIPLLSLGGFVVLAGCLVLFSVCQKRNPYEVQSSPTH